MTSEIDDREWVYNPQAGEILLEEFLRPLGMTQAALARAIGLPVGRVRAVVRGQRPVDMELDRSLGGYFGLSEGFFLRLQAAYDLREQHRRLAAD